MVIGHACSSLFNSWEVQQSLTVHFRDVYSSRSVPFFAHGAIYSAAGYTGVLSGGSDKLLIVCRFFPPFSTYLSVPRGGFVARGLLPAGVPTLG